MRRKREISLFDPLSFFVSECNEYSASSGLLFNRACASRPPTSKRQMTSLHLVSPEILRTLRSNDAENDQFRVFYGERKQATTKYYFSCLGSPTFDKVIG